MKGTYISRALALEMERAGITQNEIATRAHITQPSAWRILHGRCRLAPETLRLITHCMIDHNANGRLLIAHLRDELQRAGWDPETSVQFAWPDGSAAQSLRHDDIETLRRHIADPDVAAVIRGLALLLERADISRITSEKHSREPSLAADPHGPEYKTSR
jgi:transcriptional regulator with XRE-family HTH domain